MSKLRPRIFIVVPCLNEHTVIPGIIHSLQQYEYEIVVVDDGSEPSLESLVDAFLVYYLRHIVNLGQGAALQTGVTFALNQGADIVVHFDGDGQHSADEIATLIDPILVGKADVVLGSRFLRPEDSKDVPWDKHLILRVARIFNGLLTGVWLTDAHNGFRAMSREAASSIQIAENRMAHATEILRLIKREKLRVKEVPTQIRYTSYSQKKGQSSWNIINILIDLLIKRWI